MDSDALGTSGEEPVDEEAAQAEISHSHRDVEEPTWHDPVQNSATSSQADGYGTTREADAAIAEHRPGRLPGFTLGAVVTIRDCLAVIAGQLRSLRRDVLVWDFYGGFCSGCRRRHAPECQYASDQE